MPIAAPPFQPSEPPPLANMVPGRVARHVIGDRRIIGDAFVEHDRLEPDLTAHAGGQIFRRDDVAARRLAAVELGLPLSMALGVVTAAAFRGFLVDLDAVEASVQLREARSPRRPDNIAAP